MGDPPYSPHPREGLPQKVSIPSWVGCARSRARKARTERHEIAVARCRREAEGREDHARAPVSSTCGFRDAKSYTA